MQQMRKAAKTKSVPKIERFYICKFNLVRERGLEPPHLAAHAPKACVSTIPPLARALVLYHHSVAATTSCTYDDSSSCSSSGLGLAICLVSNWNARRW